MTINSKLGGAVMSLGAAFPSLFTNGMTQPVLSVGVSTIAGAALGTYAAIGYDDRVIPRGKLLFVASSTAIIASALVGVLPGLAGWHWINKGVEGGTAALCAFVLYYLLPEAIPTGQRLIRNFKLSDLAFFRKRQSPTDPQNPEGDPPR
jgi:hypothetical protein